MKTEAELDAAADRLMELAEDATLIPGIYNYCDRWCERCPQTARCLNFKMAQTATGEDGLSGTHGPANQKFWDDLSATFALTAHMIRREAKERGVDLDSPELMAVAEAEERVRVRPAAREGSALHQMAKGYAKSVGVLLGRLTQAMQAVEAALNEQMKIGVGVPYDDAAGIRDALEVVQWYRFFIEVKLSRADEGMVGADGFPSDADGSVKVALVAIDRSMAAWVRLREHLDDEADVILDLLVQLERLRVATEREFPQARGFHRPGLD